MKVRIAAIMPLAESIDSGALQLVALSAERLQAYQAAASDIDKIWQDLTRFAALQRDAAGTARDTVDQISLAATAIGVTIAVFAGIGLVVTFKGPINQITAAMRRLASGDLETAVAADGRADEIGEMARALGVFKENAIAKIRVEEESEKTRQAAETERLANEAQKRETEEQVDYAVRTLAEGLERFATGDVSATIDTPFAGGLERLRLDFNRSLVRLQSTIDRSNQMSVQSRAMSARWPTRLTSCRGARNTKRPHLKKRPPPSVKSQAMSRPRLSRHARRMAFSRTRSAARRAPEKW